MTPSHAHSAKLGALRLGLRLAALRVLAWLLRRELIVVALLEHFGDIVACEPVVGHLRRQHRRPWLVWICRPGYAELVRHHPGIDFVATVPCLTSWIIARRYRLAHQQVDLHVNGRSCPVCLRALENDAAPGITLANYYSFGSLQRAFTLAAGLPALDEAPSLHFPADIDLRLAALAVPRDCIVFHGKSNEAARDWPLDRWLPLLRQISARHRIPIIEVGLASVLPPGESGVINLCGRLSLLETARVIQRARLFVGIDSGPAQLANAARCESVILLGNYRGFGAYMPYSGFFPSGGATILRTAGDLALLSVDEVASAIGQRLAKPAQPAATPLARCPA